MKASLSFVILVLLAVAGVSLGYALGASAIAGFLLTDSARFLAAAPQRIASQVDVFAFMAMPLFILAGELMNRAGVTRSLIDFSMLMLGRLRGGLGHVNIMTSVFFAGISGSAAADVAALSNTFVPQMERSGYDRTFAGALTAAGSVIGPIIPPSIIFILYGAIMSTDVAALFAAGLVPGLLLAVSLFIANAIIARREGHPGGRKEDLPPLGPTVRRALAALILPAIIVGGIVFGVMTPIEAGALACLAAIIIGLVSRELDFASVVDGLRKTTLLTGSIFLIVAAAALLSYLLVLHQVPDGIASFVTQLNLDGRWFILLLIVTYLILGMGFDFMLSLTVISPILVPIAIAQGAHPVALGVMICLNLAIGLITPPMGGALIMVSTITGESYWKLCRRVLPFVVAELAVLVLVAFVPEISLALPRIVGLI